MSREEQIQELIDDACWCAGSPAKAIILACMQDTSLKKAQTLVENSKGRLQDFAKSLEETLTLEEVAKGLGESDAGYDDAVERVLAASRKTDAILVELREFAASEEAEASRKREQELLASQVGEDKTTPR